MKVKIIEVSKEDAFYNQRHKYEGKIGDFKIDNDWRDGWYGGVFSRKYQNTVDFYEVKYELVEDK